MIVYRNHKQGSKKEDKSYVFLHKGVEVKDENVLTKIKKLAIPPAYTKVKIDLSPAAKIMYEGYDDKGRLQQKYSKLHTDRTKKEKFCRLIEFGKSFPKIQADIKQYLGSSKITQNKIIAIILQIIWKCGFRIGNVKYQHLYESHGISNIYKRHIAFTGSKAMIEFKGKKGVINKCRITDIDLLRELKCLTQNKEEKEYVFTYKVGKEDELIRPVEINQWLGRYGKISSKDLRTFDANVMFIDFIRGVDLKLATSKAKRKKVAKLALEETARHINNTPGICKSSYLMGEVYTMFVEQARRYKKYFLSNVNSRIAFINFLKDYCK